MFSIGLDQALDALANNVDDTAREIKHASKINELRVLHRQLVMQAQILDNYIEIAKIEAEDD